MNNDNKNRAFTLIELLVVIVIFGIILSIALSSVSGIIYNRKNKFYQVHMKVVETAMTNYIDRNRGQLLNSEESCFVVDYNTLILEGLRESDIKCSGSIIISKIANSNNFNKEYYLTCVNQDGDNVKKSNTVPSGCKKFD